jgi:hypothetical protein
MKRVKPTKLGRCLYCMRWSVRGTIAAWSSVALLSIVWPDPTTLILATFMAVSFTVLTALHSAVLAVRVVRKSPATSDLGRRQFLARLVKVGAVAFISSFEFGVLPGRVLGQGSGLRPPNGFCVRLCQALFPPGSDREQCISEGARGQGICVEGPCVPAPDPAEGFKPKTDQQTKLARLLANNPIPNALAGSFFRLAHRFTLGRAPANELEAEVFEVLGGLSPDVRTVLECSLRRFDALPLDDRRRLFGPAFADLVDEPVSADRLAPVVADELIQRASLAAFDDPECATNERPGRPRQVSVSFVDNDFITGFWNRIHRVGVMGREGVDWLRTAAFRPPPGAPPLTPADLEREEIECIPNLQDPRVCDPLTTNCPGQFLGVVGEGVCLRVPEVVAGESVLLEGFNFFDVNARVVLSGRPPLMVVRPVAAHVCGDVTTPVTEMVGGQERVIADSRVQDKLSFTVPEDLPPGLYFVQVIVPNTVGDPCCTFSEYFTTGAQPVIRVVPPPTATFQIASEQLVCVDETNPESFLGVDEGASDEVGIRITTIPVGRDLSLGEMRVESFRFGDVDSGDTRAMTRELFRGSNFGGVVMAIVGFEVDNETAYERMIDEFTEAYWLAVKAIWEALAGAGLGGAIAMAAAGVSLGTALIVGAIALLVVAAAIAVFALWAPPDLIIEDPRAVLDVVTFAQLTAPGVPLPSIRTFTSPGDIDVTVTPVNRVASEYREQRRYRSEDSTYEITLRYIRL